MGGRAWLFGLLLCGAATAHAQSSPVIGPGNEQVVTRMLTAELPEGCALAGASIEADRIEARFACDPRLTASAPSMITLRHRDDPRGGPRRTARFALEGPSGPLLDAVVASVRAHEQGFVWSEAAEAEAPPDEATPEPDEAPPPVRAPVWQPLASAGFCLLLLVGLLFFMPSDGASPGPPAHRGLAAVLLLALAARVAAAWWLPWDTDEVSSLPSGGWRALLTEDHDLLLHPPVHRLLLAAIPGLGECPPRWLPRLPSVVASVLAVGLTYDAARVELGPRRALLPAALLALTPLDVFVGALARPYALVGLGFALLVWGAWPAVTARAERRHWVGLCGGLALLCWADYLGAALGGLLVLAALVTRRARGLAALGPGLAVGAVGVVAAGPWIRFAWAGLGFHGARHASSGSWPLREGAASALAALGVDWTGGAVAAALALALLAMGLRRRETWGATAATVGIAVLLAGLAQHLYLRPRNVAFLCGPIALAVALAWSTLPDARRALPVAAALALLLTRFEQPAQLVGDADARPPSWASEVVLGDELAALGPRLSGASGPILIDVAQDGRVVGRNLFDDRCMPVREADHPDVAAGRALGAVRECEVPDAPRPARYLQRHRCEGTPPGCEAWLRGRSLRVFRCPR